VDDDLDDDWPNEGRVPLTQRPYPRPPNGLPPPPRDPYAPAWQYGYNRDAPRPPLEIGRSELPPVRSPAYEPQPPAPPYGREPFYGPQPGVAPHHPAQPPAAQAPVEITPRQYAALPPEVRPEEGNPRELPPHLRRQLVNYQTKEPPGTIVVDTANTYLYLVLGEGKAIRYGIGVGREGFTWSGVERISAMREWPDWHPPAEMIERQPYLPRFMAGGPGNPLGARALYLGKTLFRIHGTNQPSTIGQFVSSGCIRLLNEDIEDLYNRVQVGTRVVVLPGKPRSAPSAAAQEPPGRGTKPPASN
jgi:lipoprotein-anchoring transpeptidase ErfK/SrfK